MYVLLFGQAPFQDADIKEQYRKIKENNLAFPAESSVSQNAKDFLKQGEVQSGSLPACLQMKSPTPKLFVSTGGLKWEKQGGT